MTSTATVGHADPNHSAIAAILSLDLDAYSDLSDAHAAIAAALGPHLAAAPPVREWDCDDEWTAAEEACIAAATIVAAVRFPTGDDPWLRCRKYVDRLRMMQTRHREGVGLNRLGEFAGFKVRAQSWWSTSMSVRIWKADMAIDLDAPILTLAGDATRREVGIAIAAWKSGHELGWRRGGDRVREGIKSLLEIEPA
ncbi:hypothetical protein [Methylobacterium sp. 37f]|uniref:hypothetical protein n=1 Tax=Methylobacterium sp. 37f TaxID=2817058 RepID=UPI001FFD0B66|nr:hypothetical protein [Methylobacterium sp. 37f]MCK2055309.1 hypothetical protein [Methylobacterium sp. 37f]